MSARQREISTDKGQSARDPYGIFSVTSQLSASSLNASVREAVPSTTLTPSAGGQTAVDICECVVTTAGLSEDNRCSAMPEACVCGAREVKVAAFQDGKSTCASAPVCSSSSGDVNVLVSEGRKPVSVSARVRTTCSLFEADNSAGVPGSGEPVAGKSVSQFPCSEQTSSLTDAGHSTTGASSSVASAHAPAVHAVDHVTPAVSTVLSHGPAFQQVPPSPLCPLGTTDPNLSAEAYSCSEVDDECVSLPDQEVPDAQPQHLLPSPTQGFTAKPSVASRFERFKQLMESVSSDAGEENAASYYSLFEDFISEHSDEGEEEDGDDDLYDDDDDDDNVDSFDGVYQNEVSHQLQGVQIPASGMSSIVSPQRAGDEALHQNTIPGTGTNTAANQISINTADQLNLETSQPPRYRLPPISTFLPSDTSYTNFSNTGVPGPGIEASDSAVSAAEFNCGQGSSGSERHGSFLQTAGKPAAPEPVGQAKHLSIHASTGADRALMPPPDQVNVRKARKSPSKGQSGESPQKQARLETHTPPRAVSRLNFDRPASSRGAASDQRCRRAPVPREASIDPCTSGTTRQIFSVELELKMDQIANEIRRNLCTVKPRRQRTGAVGKMTAYGQFYQNFESLLAYDTPFKKAFFRKHRDLERQFLRYKDALLEERDRRLVLANQRQQEDRTSPYNHPAVAVPANIPPARCVEDYMPSGSSTSHTRSATQRGPISSIPQTGPILSLSQTSHRSSASQTYSSSSVSQKHSNSPVSKTHCSSVSQTHSGSVSQTCWGTTSQTGHSPSMSQTEHSLSASPTGHSSFIEQTGHVTSVSQTGHSPSMSQTRHSLSVSPTCPSLSALPTGHSPSVSQTGHSTLMNKRLLSSFIEQTGHNPSVSETGHSSSKEHADYSSFIEQTGPNPATPQHVCITDQTQGLCLSGHKNPCV